MAYAGPGPNERTASALANDRLPSLRGMQAFWMAARLSSFRAAAEALHLTPSAISHAIRTLERDLDATLFERTPRGLRLTETGAEYYATVARAFEALQAGSSAVRARRRRHGLMLNVVQTFAGNWLVPRLPDLHARHPDFTLDIRIKASIEDIEFDPGRVDVAVRFGLGDWPGFVATPLLPCRRAPVCNPTVAERLSKPEDLAQETWLHLTVSPEAWDHWTSVSGFPGMRGAANLVFEDPEIRNRAAASGLGISLGIDCIMEPYFASRQLVAPFPLWTPIPEHYWFLCRPEDAADPRVVLFRDWLVETAASS